MILFLLCLRFHLRFRLGLFRSDPGRFNLLGFDPGFRFRTGFRVRTGFRCICGFRFVKRLLFLIQSLLFSLGVFRAFENLIDTGLFQSTNIFFVVLYECHSVFK